MPPFGHYPAVIKAVVLDHIRAHGDDGSLTARVVREETERRDGGPGLSLVQSPDTRL